MGGKVGVVGWCGYGGVGGGGVDGGEVDGGVGWWGVWWWGGGGGVGVVGWVRGHGLGCVVGVVKLKFMDRYGKPNIFSKNTIGFQVFHQIVEK